MGTILHLLKPVALALMVFFSLQSLGFGGGAVIFSMVPLLLGILNVFTTFAYGLSAFIFILACSFAVVPDWQTKSEELVNWVLQQGAKPIKPVAPPPATK